VDTRSSWFCGKYFPCELNSANSVHSTTARPIEFWEISPGHREACEVLVARVMGRTMSTRGSALPIDSCELRSKVWACPHADLITPLPVLRIVSKLCAHGIIHGTCQKNVARKTIELNAMQERKVCCWAMDIYGVTCLESKTNRPGQKFCINLNL
jgi:hypothetical protein